MGNAMTLKDLRETPDERLIELHDALVPNVDANVSYYLTELARRDAGRQTAKIVTLTWAIAAMTGAVFALTVVNVLVVWLHR